VPSPSRAEARGAPENPIAAAAPAPAPEKPAGPADTAPEQKVIAMSELPAAVRQALPPMQILLHQYSPRPRNRFVTINNQTLQEGESVAPGLTLEQITPDGMVLSFMGYRFRRGVP
jgi:general secretion pathway protein B